MLIVLAVRQRRRLVLRDLQQAADQRGCGFWRLNAFKRHEVIAPDRAHGLDGQRAPGAVRTLHRNLRERFKAAGHVGERPHPHIAAQPMDAHDPADRHQRPLAYSGVSHTRAYALAGAAFNCLSTPAFFSR